MSEVMMKDRPFVKQEAYPEGIQEVIAYTKAHETAVPFKGKDGKELCGFFYKTEQEPKGTILMLHGFTENAEKFREVIYAFLHLGYCVAIYDQRGHGRSYRYDGVEATWLTHIDRFETYIDDFEQACQVFLPDAPGPYILWGHSMGGAVAALGLEKQGDKTPFSKALLNSPMIAASTGGVPAFVGRTICRLAILFGKSKKIIFLSKPYTGEEKFEDSCATSKERFDWYDSVKASHKEFQNSSPSYRWTLESLKVTGKILKKGAVERITIPVRLFQAGLDNTVLPEPQNAFVARLPKGDLIRIDKAKHEIYRSNDPELLEWWENTVAFLEQ